MNTLDELFNAAPREISEAGLQAMAPTLIGQFRNFPRGVIGAKGAEPCEITEAVVTGSSITLTLKRPSGHTFQLTPI